MTRNQIILRLLLDARIRDARPDKKGWLLRDASLPEDKVWISGGFRPIYYFQGPDKGGSAADVRLRELFREHLVPKELRNHRWQYWDSHNQKMVQKSTPIYRLDMTPEEIELYPWDPAWEKPFTWEFDWGVYQAIKDRLNPPIEKPSHFKPVEIHQDQVGQLSFG